MTILRRQPKRIKREKKSKRSDTTAESEKLPTLPTLADLISRELIFDLLLITPTKKELSLLASDYETNALERCLPTFQADRSHKRCWSRSRHIGFGFDDHHDKIAPNQRIF